MSPAIEVQGVVKSYGSFSLGPLDFTIPKGYVTVLAGDNGAGKTTFLQLLADLVRPEIGEIRYFGEQLNPAAAETRKRSGFFFEELPFFPELSAKKLFKFLGGVYPKWNPGIADMLLHKFEVPENTVAQKLSRGQGKKLKLAAIFASQPDVLVLDEPFEALDPVSSEILIQLIRDFQIADERTVLLSSHRLGDVERLADYVLILRKGKLVFNGSITDLAEKCGERMALNQMVTLYLTQKTGAEA